VTFRQMIIAITLTPVRHKRRMHLLTWLQILGVSLPRRPGLHEPLPGTMCRLGRSLRHEKSSQEAYSCPMC